MQRGARLPEACVPVTCMQNASLSRQEKLLALASTRKNLASSGVAMTMRRLFWSCGGAGCRDILGAEGADESLGCDKDEEACEV